MLRESAHALASAGLADSLSRAGLDAVGVLTGYQLPNSSKRVDAILCGVHPLTGADSYVAMELKQWTNVEPVDGAPELCSVDGRGGRPVLVPSDQVARYCAYLRDSVATFADGSAELAGAAVLPRVSRAGSEWLLAGATSPDHRLFTGADHGELVEFLSSRLTAAAGAAAAERLLSAERSNAKKLMQVAADEVREHGQFVLLDEQRVAYGLVMRALRRAAGSAGKEVVIVTGGPGSGKSAIALSLLGEADRLGLRALHATGSRSFTTTLRRTAGHRDTRVRNVFKYFNNFIETPRDGLDILVSDEAHRIRATSADRYTKAALRTGKPQVDELIDAARVPVFLLDEHQSVRPGEIGTVAAIEAAATRRGLGVHRVDLSGQFRAGGSTAYERWVLRLLGLEPGGPVRWVGDERFGVSVAESPGVLEAQLAERLATGQSARITAGFCWNWSEPVDKANLVPDVVIGDWRRPWNVKGDRAVGTAPPSALWATADGGFGQIGCVYTAQGFEYDWSGVIFGPDLVRRGGEWVAVRGASADKEMRKCGDEEFDRLVRNIYKVLLTRGLRGAVLYSVDPQTQRFLRGLAPAHP